MAYTPVPTQNTTGTWTAAEHNTYVRDNFAAGIPGLMTTKGDLVAATGTDAGARLAAGSDGQALQVVGAATSSLRFVTMNTKAQAQYKVSATQTVPTSTVKIVNYHTSVYDTASAVTTGASWKFTCNATGYYYLTASALLQATSTWTLGKYAKLQAYIGSTGNAILSTVYTRTSASSGFRVYLSGGAVLSLAVGNEVSVRINQTSGSTLTIDDSGDYSRVSISGLF